MNSQRKTTTDEITETRNSENKQKSNSQNNGNNSSNNNSSEGNDFRQQVSQLAATGASIAIKKAFEASFQTVSDGNSSSQLENVNWRKLLVWVAISGVTIGVAKFLNSDTVDDFVKDYLED